MCIIPWVSENAKALVKISHAWITEKSPIYKCGTDIAPSLDDVAVKKTLAKHAVKCGRHVIVKTCWKSRCGVKDKATVAVAVKLLEG